MRSLSVFATLVAFVHCQSCPIVIQHLSDPPYENYFYSDCNVDAQVVVTSPLPDSNLTIIGPRLIVAWPAGNSGICTFFQPQNRVNGSLGIELMNSTVGQPLSVYTGESTSDIPDVGVQGVIAFNSSAVLTIPILGSVRNIRDFTEGPSLLQPVIQDAIVLRTYNSSGASYSRLWLDNTTITTFNFLPWQNSGKVTVNPGNRTISFQAGFYQFQAYFNYPQLKQLTPQQVLNNGSQSLIMQQPAQTTSLSFLSYSEKLLAGAWRFLTYFGRDSMISALLLEPVLSTGNASAMEAVIGAVLERINRTDGSVCHEETIGDYATYLNLQNNITSTAAGFTYPMIDTDFYLPILMSIYFSKYPDRVQPLLSRQAGQVDTANQNLTWGQLALLNAQKIVNITAPFVSNQSAQNLLHLKSDQIVGNWRDSTYGLANGRIPFDVNCALAPAALRAISHLATIQGVFPNNTNSTSPLLNYSNWTNLSLAAAKTWEENTLPFFELNISMSDAATRLNQFVSQSTFYNGPTSNDSLTDVTFHALALNGTIALMNQTSYEKPIPILHTDTGFHLFLLNLTNTSSPAYQAAFTRLLNSTAQSILRPFPAGLLTSVGMVVANPALSNDSTLIANFTNAAYHGTVVWSWQLALMAEGLRRQLATCNSSFVPNWCNDTAVYNNTKTAYNVLWKNIDANSAQLQSEVWSWTYSNGNYTTTPLGSLPPPPGVSGGTESDVRQLWSLSFLSVQQDQAYSS